MIDAFMVRTAQTGVVVCGRGGVHAVLVEGEPGIRYVSVIRMNLKVESEQINVDMDIKNYQQMTNMINNDAAW